MRHFQTLAIVCLSAAWLAGCPVKPKHGECRDNADCAGLQGFGAVCVEGRCQECGADADCKAGFVCRSWKCLPRPECAADADCPEGKRCSGDRCVAAKAGERQRECATHADCGEGRTCDADGRCVAADAGAGAAEAACADPATWVIRFGFDEAAVSGDARTRLQKVADCLRRKPATRVVITGHCDDRGTTQYNLALGSRRAEATRKYLGELGVAGQFESVTMGKEKPLCTESTEACWAQNRRAEILVSR